MASSGRLDSTFCLDTLEEIYNDLNKDIEIQATEKGFSEKKRKKEKRQGEGGTVLPYAIHSVPSQRHLNFLPSVESDR